MSGFISLGKKKWMGSLVVLYIIFAPYFLLHEVFRMEQFIAVLITLAIWCIAITARMAHVEEKKKELSDSSGYSPSMNQS